jgi:hypothetical protein
MVVFSLLNLASAVADWAIAAGIELTSGFLAIC